MGSKWKEGMRGDLEGTPSGLKLVCCCLTSLPACEFNNIELVERDGVCVCDGVCDCDCGSGVFVLLFVNFLSLLLMRRKKLKLLLRT